MRLTMLGTGNALVTDCFNTCFVIEDGGKYFMVDGGGGNAVLSQLKKCGTDWSEIRDIFVTHKHLDHIMGIIWMVRMICQNMKEGKYEGEARIYGHSEVIELVRDMACKLLNKKETAFIDGRLKLITVQDGETLDIINHKVSFFDIGSTKAKQYGFLMDINGEKFAFCGDEPCSEKLYPQIMGSKWMLHEAFCLYSERDIFHPYEKHHSTVKDACETAEKLGIKNLLLYHTEDRNLSVRKELYTKEGQEFFHGNLFIPDDLEVLDV